MTELTTSELLSRLDAMITRVLEQVAKKRTTNTEEPLARVDRRLDRLEARVRRIERRLDLING